MKLDLKIQTTRLDIERVRRGSLTIDGCILEGPADGVIAVLSELLNGRANSLAGLPVLAPGEPFPATSSTIEATEDELDADERPLGPPDADTIQAELAKWRLRERVVGGSHLAQELRARASIVMNAVDAYLQVIKGFY